MDAFVTSLDTICKKSLREIFAKELPKIAANIADPETSAKAPRTLTVFFKFVPYPDRSGATVIPSCKENLAGLDISAATDTVHIAKIDGKYVMFSRDIRQEMLFAGEEKESAPDGKSAGAGD